MPIRLLDDKLINKIAAGEVIEKPASVVKELVENALDAGASAIKVTIAGGGLQLIDIEDDGSGLNYDEIPLAFLRHATSKLSAEADLFDINTMGFRGEALPSIASVSRIEVFSKAYYSEGVYARLEAGNMEEIMNYPCPEGTRMVIKDLFFNTPARKKFMKSPVSEGNAVYDTIVKYALARPDVCFTFSNDKKTFFKTPGNGRLRETAVALFGADYAGHLIEIEHSYEATSLHGLIGAPELTRANRKHEFFCVNRRPVRSPMVYRALDAAYAGFLLTREYPVVMLNLSLPTNTIDVNVHPQKNEIRFQDEKAIFDYIYGVLRERLKGADFSPRQIPISEGLSLQRQAGYYTNNISNMVAEGELPLSFRENKVWGLGTSGDKTMFRDSRRLDSSDNTPNVYLSTPSAESDTLSIEPGQELQIIGQTLNSYILIEAGNSLWLIDQHAAHERIIYSGLLEAVAIKDEPSQILALPLTLELSTRDMDNVEKHTHLFEELGFHVEALGPNTLAVRSAPALISGSEDEVIAEILDAIEERGQVNIKEKALALMACKKAIKAGERLNFNQMERLVIDLLSSSDYKNCPHGRPTMMKLSHRDLDRMFKR
ncbi:MAG: DNA mismatch repair endonuclease MutL [Syntrophomonadaceae bacterium]|nr:DNA mismatch repair endonuclease MutL [Syntrophomonadaceae bacterium]